MSSTVAIMSGTPIWGWEWNEKAQAMTKTALEGYSQDPDTLSPSMSGPFDEEALCNMVRLNAERGEAFYQPAWVLVGAVTFLGVTLDGIEVSFSFQAGDQQDILEVVQQLDAQCTEWVLVYHE